LRIRSFSSGPVTSRNIWTSNQLTNRRISARLAAVPEIIGEFFDGFLKIFADDLGIDQDGLGPDLDHHRGFARRVQVLKFVALLPWRFAHEFIADRFLPQEKPDLARKRTKRKLK